MEHKIDSGVSQASISSFPQNHNTQSGETHIKFAEEIFKQAGVDVKVTFAFDECFPYNNSERPKFIMEDKNDSNAECRLELGCRGGIM